MALFGGNQDVWEELCRQTGAHIVEQGKVHKGKRVELNYKNWTIILERYAASNGSYTTTYNRIKAAYIHNELLNFGIGKKSFISRLFGRKKKYTSNDEFNKDFFVQTKQETKIREFLSNALLVQKMTNHNKFSLKSNVYKKKEQADLLTIYISEDCKDLIQLKSYFEIMKIAFDQLEAIHVAKPEKIGFEVK